jgi:FAD/FMN-containing dehydrogenase
MLLQLRRTIFGTLTSEHVGWFKAHVGQVLAGREECAPYNLDWIRKYRGRGELVLLPGSTQEVAQALAYCREHRLAVVPQGGNTGLVGGSVPVQDEIVLSTRRLNKVLSFNPVSQTLTCEAGCILQDLNEHVGQYQCEMPLDLGAKGSCMIGGNIATHAGGQYMVRHGPFRAHVLGLEVVLADGRVLNLMSNVRKDNTGYDLKQLFIGSEGTLGVITKATINCVRKAPFKQVVLCKAPSF